MSTPRTVAHPLEFPVNFNGKEIKEITIRRPKGRDLRLIPGGSDISIEDMFPFFAQLLSAQGEMLSEEFLEELDTADLNAIGETVAGFSNRGGKKAIASRAKSSK